MYLFFIYMFICSPPAFHFFFPYLSCASSTSVCSFHSFMYYFFLPPCLVSSYLTSYCEVLSSNIRLIIAYHDRFFLGVLIVSTKILGFYLKLSHDNFVARATQISIYSLSWSLTAVLSELSTQHLNKQQIKRTTCHVLLFLFFCGFYLYCFHFLRLSL
jgi:hypothetical protein